MILKGISKGVKKLVVQLSYPSDEVGNSFVTPEQIYEKGVNPYSDVFTAEEFRKTFGDVKHIFTGVDYIDYYEKTGNCKVILANDPCEISQTHQIRYQRRHSHEKTHQREIASLGSGKSRQP